MSLVVRERYNLLTEPQIPVKDINITREGFVNLISPLISEHTADWSRAREWFQLNPMRADSVRGFNLDRFFEMKASKLLCSATARAVFSIFVDYSHKAKDEDFKLAYWHYEQIGVEALKEKIAYLKYAPNNGLAALCSLLDRDMKKHLFVLEMTPNRQFRLFQSYLIDIETGYTLQDWLKLNKVWTEEELVEKFSILESERASAAKKTQVYHEMFNVFDAKLPVLKLSFIPVTYECRQRQARAAHKVCLYCRQIMTSLFAIKKRFF